MVAGPLPKNSRFWWVKFSVRGKVFQETANTESKNEALKFLSRRKDEEATGKAVDCEKVTVAMLAEKMMDMWKRDERKESTREWAAYCWMHLLPYFGRMKAADALLTASIEAYQDRRKAEGARREQWHGQSRAYRTLLRLHYRLHEQTASCSCQTFFHSPARAERPSRFR